MLPPYLVCEFDKKTLSSLVRERFGDDFPNIHRKRQIQFIYNYLKDLGAATVLLESEYVDKDYLEDYSRYYVRCFNRYGERCARLHFFKNDFDSNDFQEALVKNQESSIQSFQENYLGFIVVKPLPKTFIGKTCLKIYPSFSRSKNKAIISKKYDVNLFGINLSINSVAFQEQDKIVSACATTAIWSMFHSQIDTNSRKLPSCSEITLSAINHIADSSNSFPNKGLTNKQILRAIDTQNFRNHKIELNKDTNEREFIELVKILINSKIPAILGADVYKLDNEGNSKLLDGHAVTVLGFRDDEPSALYIHDDRVGPFAKAAIRNIKDLTQTLGDSDKNWCITIQDKDENGKWQQPKEILIPDSLIISTNHKVRIPLDFIENTCRSIRDEWSRYCHSLPDLTEEDLPLLEYSITLQNLSEFKSSVISDDKIKNKFEILTSGFARFLWIATFKIKGDIKVFQLVFDATEIPQGNAVSNIVVFYEEIFSEIKSLFLKAIDKGDEEISDEEHNHRNFMSSFIRNLREKTEGYEGYLTEKYGALNAPRKIKSTEIQNGNLPIRTDLKTYFGRNNKSLKDDFIELTTSCATPQEYRIWVISAEGALIIGEEVHGMGHPSLTGFKSARIAGELRFTDGWWEINAKSGRYSKNYANSMILLENALGRFLEIYNLETKLRIQTNTQ